MNLFPDLSGSDSGHQDFTTFHTPPPADDLAQGSVWLLDPPRIGHLTACLRALGLASVHEGRED